jgi:hypothetical protein
VSTGSPQQATSPPLARSPFLDAIKGLLVVTMVFFHSASAGPAASSPGFGQLLSHLAFLHTAFLLLAGFVCGWHYAPAAVARPGTVRGRVASRGAKLLLLFLALNFFFFVSSGSFRQQLLHADFSLAGIRDNLILNMSGKVVSLVILYYIGLFLVLAALVVHPRTTDQRLAVALAVCLVMAWWGRAFYFLFFGFMGMALGRLATRPAAPRWWAALDKAAVFAPFLLALLQAVALDEKLLELPFIGIALMLLDTCFWFGTFVLIFRWACPPAGKAFVVLLGQYSLVGYIGQVVILRFVNAAGARVWTHAAGRYGWNVLATLVLVGICVLVIDRWRKRAPLFNAGYRWIFG